MDAGNYIYLNRIEENVSVNIVMVTYNHGQYIRQALDSIFMQKTQYSYKIIIGEDCSTDNTRDVIMEYYRKYPEKMELVLWKNNVGGRRNAVEILKKCNGKYVAYLEGDDYWTDPLKLEKQVSFLEKNSEYVGTAHNVRCVDQTGGFLHKDFGLYPYQESHVYTRKNAINGEMIAQTASLLYKNIWKDFKEQDWKEYLECKANGDQKISAMLGIQGDIYYFNDIMADHRRVFVGDSWTAQSTNKNMLWFSYQSKCDIRKYLSSTLGIKIPLKITVKDYFEESVIRMLCKPSMENLKILVKFYREKRKNVE